MERETLLLSQSDIVELLRNADLVGTIEEAFREMGAGGGVMPPKLNMNLGEDGVSWPYHNSFVDAMPSYLESLKLAAVKIVGGYWGNKMTKLPTIIGSILLVDPVTGKLLCVMDGTWITAFRTAAVSVLGARHLGVRVPKRVGIYGAGTQGRTHAILASREFDLDEIVIFDINKEQLRDTIKTLEPLLEVHLKEGKDVPDVSKEADLVFSTTVAREPFIEARDLKAHGGFLCTIGSYSEVGKTVLDWADQIFVDNFEQASHRGALARFVKEDRAAIARRVAGELPNVLAGKGNGRTSEEQNIWYVPRGMGIADLALSALAYEQALKLQKGSKCRFEEEIDPVSSKALCSLF